MPATVRLSYSSCNQVKPSEEVEHRVSDKTLETLIEIVRLVLSRADDDEILELGIAIEEQQINKV